MSGVEPLMIAAAVASAAGSAVQGVNAYQVGAYQSKLAKEQAAQAAADASSQAQQALDEGARTLARGVTIAAQGGGLNGSALDVLGDLSRQTTYEARRLTTQGLAEAQALATEGRAAKQQGAIGAVSHGLEAASTLFSAGMKVRANRAQARAMAPKSGRQGPVVHSKNRRIGG